MAVTKSIRVGKETFEKSLQEFNDNSSLGTPSMDYTEKIVGEVMKMYDIKTDDIINILPEDMRAYGKMFLNLKCDSAGDLIANFMKNYSEKTLGEFVIYMIKNIPKKDFFKYIIKSLW